MAPILTIFIGGNHEASNFLQELPYGGWVAPNIYYLGYAGVVNYKGLRIAGISGIYYGYDYFKGHHESPPYDQNSIRSVYHYRQLEIFRLQQVSQNVDIMVSHDWPTDVYNYGDAAQLIRFKPHFRDEIHENKLGSPPLYELMKIMKPEYWFAGHLHCKFAAVVPHEEDNTQTKFLALDKCLPKRRFLQFLDIDVSGRPCTSDDLQYDLEWLTVLYLTKHLTHVRNTSTYMPGQCNTSSRWDFRPTDEEKALISKNVKGQLVIPKTFKRTVAPYDPASMQRSGRQPRPILNAQTVDFCNMLSIDDPLYLVVILSGQEFDNTEYRDDAPPILAGNAIVDSSKPNITSAEQINERLSLKDSLAQLNPRNRTINPEEDNIHLSDDDDDDEDEDVLGHGISGSTNTEGAVVEVEFDAANDIIDDDDEAEGADDDGDEENDNERQADDSELEPSVALAPDDGAEQFGLSEVPIKPAPKRESIDGSADATASPTMKKFKRRNAAIYSAEDDD